MSATVRLIPRWFAVVVIGALTLFVLGFLVLALSVEGLMRWSAWGLWG